MRTFRRAPLLTAFLSLVFTAPVTPAVSATLPAGFAETRLASGLDRPTAMAVAPDGRIFVCEEKGRLRIIKGGALLPTPFVRLQVFAHGERGLLGIALDPDFERNHFLYLYYTARKPTAHNRLSRFVADGDVARPGSETPLIEFPPLVTELHNSGTLRFGPDGKLYITVGENYIPENAQRLDNPLGKVLRVNKDGSIPADNPFYTRTTGLAKAIWALGLRNPFSFAFQRTTGRMFINDFGKHTWEESNVGVAGANYGWPLAEGPSSDPKLRGPVFAYEHGNGPDKGCAITGGTFYDPVVALFPEGYPGTYFYSDFCNGWIRRFDPASGASEAFADGIPSPVGLTVGDDGSLYYLAHKGGEVYQVRFTGSGAPSVSVQPEDQRVAAGESVRFAVEASGTAPLTYQWRRNGVRIPGATAAQYTLPSVTAADDGARFAVVVRNAFGSTISRPVRLEVVAGHRPVAAITSPVPGTLYRGGETFVFRGGATDAEDGALPPSALTWRIDFHHDEHLHPFLLDTAGIAQGMFTVPRQGETAPNVWYRIHLFARDRDGLVAETFVDVRPRHATITVATSPPGLRVMLDGTPRTAPFSELGVVGITRTLGVVSSQTLNGETYEFVSWSDGGAASHPIVTPEADATWTATLRKVVPR